MISMLEIFPSWEDNITINSVQFLELYAFQEGNM